MGERNRNPLLRDIKGSVMQVCKDRLLGVILMPSQVVDTVSNRALPIGDLTVDWRIRHASNVLTGGLKHADPK